MTHKEKQIILRMYWALHEGLEAALNVYEEDHQVVLDLRSVIKEAEEEYECLLKG